MSSFEIGAPRPVGATSLNPVSPATAVPAPAGPSQTPAPVPAGATTEVQTSLAVGAGTVPLDQDRVAQIRKAVESGTYPVIPTRISDAMIAAGMMLRKAT
jgi:negative regulator of flagellin synthesis FlgM